MTKQEFINTIQPTAVKLHKEGNCLPSLTLAQACLESNFGQSAPGNMLFGIKWSEGCGHDFQLKWTHEYIKGKNIRVQAKFRRYNSFEESIIDHAELFNKARYKPVLETKTYKDACIAVQACGYATDPIYAKQLIGLIEKYNLNQWDGDYMKYYRVFSALPNIYTEIVELDPMQLKARLVNSSGMVLAKMHKNFINANLFSGTRTIGWLISGGKILSERHEEGHAWEKPKGTLIVYKSGLVDAGWKTDTEIVKVVNDIWFCCQGFNLFPTGMSVKHGIEKEGYTYDAVGYTCQRLAVGYNKTLNKIVIAKRAKSNAERAIKTMINLGCKDNAICLDSGGSVNMQVNGKSIILTDRVLTNVITW